MVYADYDLVVIGGGLGGAAIGKALAEHGARVLILECEKQFHDRIRGEGLTPWGGAEAQRLGIYQMLVDSCAYEKPRMISLGLERDLVATTQHKLPLLSFYHPEMQEVLFQAAAKAGAEVRRGAMVCGIEMGFPTIVHFQGDRGSEKATARLVIGANGRCSPIRKWCGVTESQDPDRLYIAGVSLEGLQGMRDDSSYLFINPDVGELTFLVGQGSDRARAYVGYRVERGYRLQGREVLPHFIEESVRCGIPMEFYAKAEWQALSPLLRVRIAGSSIHMSTASRSSAMLPRLRIRTGDRDYH